MPIPTLNKESRVEYSMEQFRNKLNKLNLPEARTKERNPEELKEKLNKLKLTKAEQAKKKDILEHSVKDIFSARDLNQLFSMTGQVIKKYYALPSESLEKALVSADIKMFPEAYIGRSVVAAFLVFILLFTGFLANLAFSFFEMSIILILIPFAIPALVIAAFYYYPVHKMKNKATSINTNLAFALTHMSAFASSGAPPEDAFKILTEFKEFGAIQKEAINIVNRVDVLGEDITTAIDEVSKTTPSDRFGDLLSGVLAIIRSGGNLKKYLSEMAATAMFDYRIKREHYIETLSTYADIYTAILIAAPLFLVSILTVMNIIPGSTLPGGLSISSALKIGVYFFIPLMNIIFLAVISLSQPEM